MPEILSLNNFHLTKNGVRLVYGKEPLPPYTIRLKYKQGTTPTFDKGTGVLIDSTNNIWDLTYENPDWSNLLQSHTNLLEVIDGNTSGVTNMSNMFHRCTSLTSVPLFDTSNVTRMWYMFDECSALQSVPLFDTSNVTDMGGMLEECTALQSVPLFDTSNVTNMDSTFFSCTSLTSVPLFDTSNVTDMDWMFYNCKSLTSVLLFDTSNVTNMSYMFYQCINVQIGALALYQQASSQTNPPTSHTQTFRNCGSNTQTGAAELAQIPSDWK